MILLNYLAKTSLIFFTNWWILLSLITSFSQESEAAPSTVLVVFSFFYVLLFYFFIYQVHVLFLYISSSCSFTKKVLHFFLLNLELWSGFFLSLNRCLTYSWRDEDKVSPLSSIRIRQALRASTTKSSIRAPSQNRTFT